MTVMFAVRRKKTVRQIATGRIIDRACAFETSRFTFALRCNTLNFSLRLDGGWHMNTAQETHSAKKQYAELIPDARSSRGLFIVLLFVERRAELVCEAAKAAYGTVLSTEEVLDWVQLIRTQAKETAKTQCISIEALGQKTFFSIDHFITMLSLFKRDFPQRKDLLSRSRWISRWLPLGFRLNASQPV